MSAASALRVDTGAGAAEGAAALDEAGVRGLVEGCALNDDIAPLVRLLFEAQAEPSSPTAIDGEYAIWDRERERRGGSWMRHASIRVG